MIIKKITVLVLLLVAMFSVNTFAATSPAPLTGVSVQVPTYRTGEIDLKWRSSSVAVGYNVYVNGLKQQPIAYYLYNNKYHCTILKPSYFTVYTNYYLYNLPAGKYVIGVTVVDSTGKESAPFTVTAWIR
jgi:hypothetical protein